MIHRKSRCVASWKGNHNDGNQGAVLFSAHQRLTGRLGASRSFLSPPGAMILDIPATILQLAGVVPSLFPVWYSLCRMGVSLLAVIIAAWMLSIYRRYGVWALGKKKKTHLEA